MLTVYIARKYERPLPLCQRATTEFDRNLGDVWGNRLVCGTEMGSCHALCGQTNSEDVFCATFAGSVLGTEAQKLLSEDIEIENLQNFSCQTSYDVTIIDHVCSHPRFCYFSLNLFFSHRMLDCWCLVLKHFQFTDKKTGFSLNFIRDRPPETSAVTKIRLFAEDSEINSFCVAQNLRAHGAKPLLFSSVLPELFSATAQHWLPPLFLVNQDTETVMSAVQFEVQ